MRPTKSTTGPGGEPDVPARRGAVAGEEHAVVDARRDDLDALGVGAVVTHELILLLERRRDDEVGAAHDLGFDARPQSGVVGETDFGLHAVERVERGDQRQVELVLEPVTDRARHPVVRVEHVVVAAALEQGVRGVGELADEIGEVAQPNRRARPRGDVQDPEAGLDDDDGRLLGMFRAGEHVDRDAGARERRAQGADVHVHPTAVAGARLCERRGVHAQHGHLLHSADDPTGATPQEACGRRGRWISGAARRASVDAVDHAVELAALVRHLALQRSQPDDGVRELGVAERRQVGEQAVEPFEVGRPLAVLLRCHLQGQPARRRVSPRPGVGEDLGELLDELLERPPLERRLISASRMSMRACVSRRTYDTSVSSSTHSACFVRSSSTDCASTPTR